MTISANIHFSDSASAHAAVQAVGNFLADVRSITGADNVAITINLDIGRHEPLLAVADTMTRQLQSELDAATAELDEAQKTITAVEAWLEWHDSKRYAALCAGETTIAQALDDYHRERQTEIKRLEAELRTLRSWVTTTTGNGKTPPAAIAAAVQPAADLPQQQPPAIVAAVQAAAPSADHLDGDDLHDWIIGLDAQRHTWRTIPKPVRWRLITATLHSIWRDGRLPSMDDFNAAKPAWMPIATSIAASYGEGKWTTVCGKAAQP